MVLMSQLQDKGEVGGYVRKTCNTLLTVIAEMLTKEFLLCILLRKRVHCFCITIISSFPSFLLVFVCYVKTAIVEVEFVIIVVTSSRTLSSAPETWFLGGFLFFFFFFYISQSICIFCTKKQRNFSFPVKQLL